jgi:hypothetical protein
MIKGHPQLRSRQENFLGLLLVVTRWMLQPNHKLPVRKMGRRGQRRDSICMEKKFPQAPRTELAMWSNFTAGEAENKILILPGHVAVLNKGSVRNEEAQTADGA